MREAQLDGGGYYSRSLMDGARASSISLGSPSMLLSFGPVQSPREPDCRRQMGPEGADQCPRTVKHKTFARENNRSVHHIFKEKDQYPSDLQFRGSYLC
jgi:hypothetical protein